MLPKRPLAETLALAGDLPGGIQYFEVMTGGELRIVAAGIAETVETLATALKKKGTSVELRCGPLVAERELTP